MAALLIATGLLGMALQQVKTYETDAAPIRYVRIEGVFEYLDKEAVKNTLRPLVATGFFSADVEAIKRAVLQMPWVARVSVKRVWPDAIDIKVYEQKAFVRWGKQSLLNERGDRFTPESVAAFGHLPVLSGPVGQEREVLEIMKGMRTALADQGMALAEFSINDRRSWKIVLTDGTEILLGRKDQLRHFQRFLSTLRIFDPEQIEVIATVDLRYPNGYAVSWKPNAESIDWKKFAEEKGRSNRQ